MASAASNRRIYIDWFRGVAVLLMIAWHAIDAWTLPAARDPRAFAIIVFFAGWAAPMFLFLAGVSVPLAASARVTRGASRLQASRSLQVRGWQVFLLAHVFRFQSFLLNPYAQWNGLLKPDILNILGLGLVAVAFCWRRAQSDRGAVIWLLLPAAAAVLLAPLAAGWWWPTLLHPRLEAYIRPVENYGVFSLFPAVGYVFAGAFLGAQMAARDDRRAGFQRRLALWGIAAALAGGIVASLPVTRWSGPAAIVLFRTGSMSAALAGAWWLLRRRPPETWSPLVVFGRTSLFVYWVHVELAYGLFTRPIHKTLSLPAALAGYVALTVIMFGAATLWAKRKPGQPLVPMHMRGPQSTDRTLMGA